MIMGAISEYDREMTVDRLAAGRAAKAARGGYAHGALPYGYRSAKGQLVPVPAEQAALAKMKALATQGVPVNEIARELTAEGTRPSGVVGGAAQRSRESCAAPT